MGISTFSMSAAPIMAYDGGLDAITERIPSQGSNWLQSISDFFKSLTSGHEQKDDGFYFEDSFLEQDEFGTWRYQVSATQETPVTQEQLLNELPKQVTLVFEGEEYLIDLDPLWWDLSLFSEGQYEGEHQIILKIPTKFLPQEYVEANDLGQENNLEPENDLGLETDLDYEYGLDLGIDLDLSSLDLGLDLDSETDLGLADEPRLESDLDSQSDSSLETDLDLPTGLETENELNSQSSLEQENESVEEIAVVVEITTETNTEDPSIREDGFYFDESNLIQDESDAWRYQTSASQEAPVSQEQLIAEFPKQVTLVFEGEEHLIDINPLWWDFSLFGESQYEGEHQISLHIPTENLPEEYVETHSLAADITVLVQITTETNEEQTSREEGIYFDGSNLIQDENGTWCYQTSASQEEPLTQDQLLNELPAQATFVFQGQEQTIDLDSSWWDLSAFNQSQYEGEHQIVLKIPTEYLPLGYVESNRADPKYGLEEVYRLLQEDDSEHETAVLVQIKKEVRSNHKDGIYFDGSKFTKDNKGKWHFQISVTQPNALTKEELQTKLPKQVTIVFQGQENLINLDATWWDLTNFGDSQFDGEHKIVLNIPEESLPKGYTLPNGGVEVFIQVDPVITKDLLAKHEVKTTVSPRGTTIDLFDYEDWLKLGEFKFTNGNNDSHIVNKWTGDLGGNQKARNRKRPMQNIVKNTLENGYPCLKIDGDTNLFGEGVDKTGIKNETSLAPLFDGTKAKVSVRGAQGLLQVDQDGYFYYNSKQNYAVLEKTENGYGNHFKVYDQPRNVNDRGIAGNIKDPNYNLQGQFFPFNPVIYKTKMGETNSVFKENNGQLENKYTSENRTPHFGAHMSTRFIHKNGGYTDAQQTKPVTYEFSGDDDVWVFIDDVLVGDVGGIHDAISLEIDFSTGKVVVFSKGANGEAEEKIETTLKKCYENAKKKVEWSNGGNGETFADDSYHTLDFFYLERGTGASNMQLKYNLLEIPGSSIIKQNQIGEAVPGAEFELRSNKDGEDILLAQGTTDQNGTFILMDARPNHDNKILSLKELYDDNFRNLTLKETKIPDGYRGQAEVKLELVQNAETGGVILVNQDPWSTGIFASPKVRTEIPPTAYIYTEGSKEGKPVTLEQQKSGTVFAVLQKRVDKDKHYDNPEAWVPIYGDREHGWHKFESMGNALEDVIQAFKKQEAEGYQKQKFSLSSNGLMAVEIADLPGDIRNYYSLLPNDEKGETEYAIGYYYSTSPTVGGITSENTWRLDSDATLSIEGNKNFDRIFATNILVPNIKNTLYVQKTDESGKSLIGAQFSLYTPDQIDDANGEIKLKDRAVAYDTITIQENGPMKNTGSFPSANHLLKEGTYYLFEDRAPDGYIRNANATKIIVNKEGVFANAGQANDGIVVARGVGGILKSMSQFATVDHIDNTLNNIKANLEVNTNDDLNTGTWQLGGNPKEMHLQYQASDETLKYGAIETTDNPNAENKSKTDTGWSRLNIKQCREHHETVRLKGASIVELGDKNITNLFSNTVTVIVENERTNPLSIKKVVQDPTQMTLLQDYEFDVHLTYGEDENNLTPVTGEYAIKITTTQGDQSQTDQSGKITFDSSGHAKILLQAGKNDQGQNVSQTVEIINLPMGIHYSITEASPGRFTTKVKTDTQVEMTSKTITGVISKTKDESQANQFSNNEITFTNVYSYLEFIKVNKESQALQGVQFGLYELNCQEQSHNHQQLLNVDSSSGNLNGDACWTKVDTFTSDQDGKVLLSGLIEGKEYRLVELKAANGYLLPQGQWTIKQNDGEQQFSFGKSMGNPPATSNSDGKYYVYNYKPNELPLTGGRGNSFFMICGTALMSLGLVMWLITHKKRNVK